MSEDLDELVAKRQRLMTWPGMQEEIETRIAALTERLIAKDDEQARGAIREMRRLIELPADLEAQASHLAAALSEQSDAAQ